ncbi:MAG: PQQ-dependent sugar dehydrogenase [Acidobacteriota bacterium]
MALENRRWANRPAFHLFMAGLVFSGVLALSSDRARSAFTVPTGFTDTLVVGGLVNPTAMEFAPDGRLFVCQQSGDLRVIKNGSLLPTPFLSVTVDDDGERGLLGIAFDPDFANNQFVYVYYTTEFPAVHNRISRFTAAGDIAAVNSEVVLMELDNLSGATNHNGGAIHFGPDGHLYVAVGDNANSANAQALTTLHGKMLRIESDGDIPTNNPFDAQTNGNRKAIWARGLRNPFTFSFQPGTGRMFINDVGQNTTEEVNDGIAGSNYGWNTCEGPCNPPNGNLRDPIYSYLNDADTCAITGGAFYNPPTVQFPATFLGTYFFADFCGGWIKNLNPGNANAVADFATSISSAVDLKVSSSGSLYYLARGAGSVRRINYPANMIAPTINPHPGNQSVVVGASATFTVGATGTPPFTYQWQRNNVDIGGETSSSYMLSNAQLSDSGATFRAIVTNSFGNATSNGATLTVNSTCAYTISPIVRNFSAKQTASSVNVTAGAGCAWSVSNTLPWVTINSGASGNGNGIVNFTVAVNPGLRRTGALTVAGQSFLVQQGANFADIAQDNIFYEYIGKISAAGITLGCDANGTIFCAENEVTREQMAAFIIRALGTFNPPSPAMQRFTDVPPSNIFYAFIEEMALRGITLGCNGQGTLYCPTNTVTRDQMAAFIIRALGEPNPPTPASQRFVDVPPASTFYAFIEEMALRGVTLGCDLNGPLYCPTGTVTRGQMAAFLARAFPL